MAFDAFMKIAGVDGESTDRFHKVEIDVLSFSWGAAVPAGGQPPGHAVAEDFRFVHKVDKASPQLMLACCIGKHFPEALLSVRKSGTTLDYLKYKFTEVIISSIAPGGGRADDVPVEEVSLNFQKIRFDYTTKQGEVVTAECDFTPVTG